MLFKVCTDWYTAHQKNMLYDDYLNCAALLVDVYLNKTKDIHTIKNAAASFHVYGKIKILFIRKWMSSRYIRKVFNYGKLTIRYIAYSIAKTKYNLNTVDENLITQLDKYFDWVADQIGNLHYVPIVEAMHKIESIIQEEDE